jgi:DNA polymerase III subunit alpha
MTLLAETTKGMHNLFRLSSRASMEGFYYKPRADRELLAEYASGLIGTTGCPSGEVQTWLRIGDYARARAAAAEFRDIFGPGNFYVELMDHGLDIQKAVQDDLLRLGMDLGLPLLATNDLHYTHPEDADAHEVLLCVQSGKTMADPSRFKLDGRDFYLKSPQEMRSLWEDKYDLKEACDNTLLVAERCAVEFHDVSSGVNLMPRFDVPAGEDASSWFVKEVERGLVARYPDGIPAASRARADYEVEMILKIGFPGYFLVVADLIAWAKAQGIRVGPGRGSATGSLVSYAMGITELDPIEHGLLFERFLNPDRVSMPDIDIDFDERRRGEVIRYVTAKYGEDRVAQVVTYGTIKSKQAIKDSSRVLGYPFSMGDRITKALPPPVMGKDVPLDSLFDATHPRYGEGGEFRALVQNDAEVAKVVETARGLEGLKRQWGVHACAVIMSSEPLLDHIPVMRREQDGAIITQFDYPTCEALGLLKMDFLGLRNLTMIDDALANIEANRGVRLTIESVGFTDPGTYELLSGGETLGVFQLDGGGLRSLLRSLRPDSFDDITAVLALYRPGPMGMNAHNDYADRKNHRKPVVPIHPELAEPLAEVLDETYGLVVYQEQVISIAQRVAGFSLARADLLRRAMGKKKKAELDAQYESFSAGMLERGFSAGAVKALWDTLLPFCDYGFNKSHGAGYAVVAYWTAYLKANYPAEYMAALLTSVADDKDKSALYLSECRRMGIKVLPPDVNESVATFAPVGRDIRFGLAAIRNVGGNVVEAIITARRSKGEFTGFTDFLRKVPLVVCNKRVIESLIKAGAFDSFGDDRKGLVLVHEQAVDAVIDIKRNEAIGQDSLFGGDAEAEAVFDVPVPAGEWDKTTRLNFEREMLGLYVSDHPLLGVEHIIARESDCSLADLMADEAEPRPRAGDRSDAQIVKVGGILSGVQRKVTKQGNQWAAATLEDLGGAIEVLFFPQTYQLYATSIAEDAVVVVKGKVDRRDDVPKLIAMDLSIPDLSVDESGPFVVSMPVARCVPPVVERLREVLVTHPGPTEVHLRLRGHERTTVVRLDDKLRVAASPALIGDLKQLLGPACVS